MTFRPLSCVSSWYVHYFLFSVRFYSIVVWWRPLFFCQRTCLVFYMGLPELCRCTKAAQGEYMHVNLQFRLIFFLLAPWHSCPGAYSWSLAVNICAFFFSELIFILLAKFTEFPLSIRYRYRVITALAALQVVVGPLISHHGLCHFHKIIVARIAWNCWEYLIARMEYMYFCGNELRDIKIPGNEL
jgi:hypothetical protein